MKRGAPISSMKILLASLANSTWKQYDSGLKSWWLFCNKRDKDPLNAEAKDLIEFLSEKFEEGASYGTLNSHRSAVALVLGEKISQNSLVTRFFKGIFKLRPCKPKYDKVWDIQIVLDEIIKLEPLANLKFAELTEKTVLLLALATAQRVQTLSLIKIDNIKELENGFEIEIPDLIKTSRPGAAQPLLIIPRFDEDPRCCPARALSRYKEVSREYRGQIKELFISTKKPFRAVSTQTISRWIKSFLHQCGIAENYTAHSTRHVSTSTALKKGVDVNIIYKAAAWSKKSKIFCKHYNRPIENSENNFATSVLSKK